MVKLRSEFDGPNMLLASGARWKHTVKKTKFQNTNRSGPPMKITSNIICMPRNCHSASNFSRNKTKVQSKSTVISTDSQQIVCELNTWKNQWNDQVLIGVGAGMRWRIGTLICWCVGGRCADKLTSWCWCSVFENSSDLWTCWWVGDCACWLCWCVGDCIVWCVELLICWKRWCVDLLVTV